MNWATGPYLTRCHVFHVPQVYPELEFHLCQEFLCFCAPTSWKCLQHTFRKDTHYHGPFRTTVVFSDSVQIRLTLHFSVSQHHNTVSCSLRLSLMTTLNSYLQNVYTNYLCESTLIGQGLTSQACKRRVSHRQVLDAPQSAGAQPHGPLQTQKSQNT